jgi:hypothetical protein
VDDAMRDGIDTRRDVRERLDRLGRAGLGDEGELEASRARVDDENVGQ